MEDINIKKNLFIKQFNQSSAIAYNEQFLAFPADYNFRILDKAYEPLVSVYAKTKIAIENNTCLDPACIEEKKDLKILEEAPQKSLIFLENLMTQLDVTQESNYDVNNNYKFLVADSILKGKPGFSMSDGYIVDLQIRADGSQVLIFNGPMFIVSEGDFKMPDPFVISDTALAALEKTETDLVVATPDINAEMLELLTAVGLFSMEDIREDKTLSPTARIKEEFILKNPDGTYDYEIIDIGNGKGRNVLKFDMDKISRKADPFINAEVSGMLSVEQDAVAAWNVYISKGTSVEEDNQMVQNANAASESWSYENDLPLDQDKKVLFETKYKEYFMNNYIKQFITNQFPTVEKDAAVFDLAEAKKAKAQKFIDDNKL